MTQLHQHQLRDRVYGESVDEFCAARGVTPYLGALRDLVHAVFDAVGPLQLKVEADPEIDETWLEVGVTVRGSTKDIVDAYDRFTRELPARIPRPAADAIRLVLNTP